MKTFSGINAKVCASLVMITIAFVFSQSHAAPKKLENDGVIPIYNYHEDEYQKIQYRDGDKYLPKGISEIRHIFRSRGDGSEREIDINLIELLDHLQDHFGVETLELISGYRSPKYNQSLLDEGKGVARESLHKQGLASDIHFDEIEEEAIFNYAISLGLGGVGIYPRHSFVHIDTGDARSWKAAPKSSRLLMGTENNPNPSWGAITDKDIYRQGEELKVRVTNNAYEPLTLVKNVWVEKFINGKWSDPVKIKKIAGSANLSPGKATAFTWKLPPEQLFGKYRLVIFTSHDFSVQPALSNEFYIKKIKE